MKDYESAESAAKAFVEEHCQQETKLAKDTTKDNLENHQLGTSLGPKQRLEMEFELLVSQLPDCRERQGLMGLWYLKCHLPPLCRREATSRRGSYVAPGQIQKELSVPTLRRRSTTSGPKNEREREVWLPNTIFSAAVLLLARGPERRQKKPLWSRGIEAEYPLSNETDEETEGRHKPPFPKDDLGEECMIVMTRRS